jgi:hypothetical protein
VPAVGGAPTNATEKQAVVRFYRFVSGEWLELGEGAYGDVDCTAYYAPLSVDGAIVAVSNYCVVPVGSA